MLADLLFNVASGKAKAADILDACLKKALAAEGGAAFSHVDPSARNAALARMAAAREKGKRPPLEGAAFVLSNRLMAEGLPAEAASVLLEGFKAPFDAAAVSDFKEAGATIVGTAAGLEFGIPDPGMESPEALEKWPAAITSGMAHAVLGVDAGGLFRQAATGAGLVALKPSNGLISRHGVVSVAPNLETVALAADSARSVAILLEVAARFDPRDTLSYPGGMPGLVESLKRPLKDAKIGVPAGLESGEADRVRTVLKDAGLAAVDVDLPSLPLWKDTHGILFHAQSSSQLGRYDGIRFGRYPQDARDWNSIYLKARAGLGKGAKLSAMLGAFALSKEGIGKYHRQALVLRGVMCRELDAAWSKCDALALPSLPGTRGRAYACGANLRGCAALAIKGAGLEIWAPPYKDGTALRIGVELERRN